MTETTVEQRVRAAYKSSIQGFGKADVYNAHIAPAKASEAYKLGAFLGIPEETTHCKLRAASRRELSAFNRIM